MGGRQLFFRTTFALLALPFAAGQSCSSDGTDRAEAILGACGQLAAAQCSYIAACLPIFASTQFGDVDACASRFGRVCEGYATWEGVGWTAEKFERCTEQVRQAACTDDATLATGACANEPGSLQNGAACVDGSQCGSGWCHRTLTPTESPPCGICRESGCLAGGCKAGEGCLATSEGSRCVEILTEGKPCSSASFCATGLSCLESTCTKSRGEGELCTTLMDCDRLSELTCFNGTCRKPRIVDIGSPCNNGDRCTQGGTCYSAQLSQPATCVAPLADGAICGAGRVGVCRTPARCVSGMCKLPTEVTCQ